MSDLLPFPAHPNGHRFHPSILREYDVRGVVGETLTEIDAYHLGRALASKAAQTTPSPTICVGYDGRTSSPSLEAALVRGLCEGGAEVLRVGLGPTPMLYFSVWEFEAAAGVMVTGSHNPLNHNGFKMMLGKDALFGEAIRELGIIAAAGRYRDGKGSARDVEVFDDYAGKLADALPAGARPLRVAWDAGNGAAGEVVESLCTRLPGEHFPLFTEIDGSFPYHHPDPSVAENLLDLQEMVRREMCDVGLAFDGDGDRLGVVDDKGRVVGCDQLLMLLARDVLSRHPGSTLIADVKTSQAFFDDTQAQGGRSLMWKTGHSHIKHKLYETGALFAGEASGHLFFADEYYGFDDGLYAAVRVLRLLAAQAKPLSALVDALPSFHTSPEIRFACDDTKKFAVIEEIRLRLAASGAEVDGTDGVRVRTPDGWWLLRASNTQAVLVARWEATSAAGLSRLQEALTLQLAQSGLDMSISAQSH